VEKDLLGEGSSLPIQGVSINWNKISEKSYLRSLTMDYIRRKHKDWDRLCHNTWEESKMFGKRIRNW